MELTVTQRRDNRMLDRLEMYFSIDHPGVMTPTREEIRKSVAGAVDVKGPVVVLDWARSEYGRPRTRGYAKVYTSREQAVKVETPPILRRNGLAPPKAEVAAKKPAGKPEKRPPKETEEAPAEAAPTPEPPKREAPKAEPKGEPKKEKKGAKAEGGKPTPKGKKPAKKKGE